MEGDPGGAERYVSTSVITGLVPVIPPRMAVPP
jgi:hypothetical protein